MAMFVGRRILHINPVSCQRLLPPSAFFYQHDNLRYYSDKKKESEKRQTSFKDAWKSFSKNGPKIPEVLSSFPTPVELNNKIDSYTSRLPSGQDIVNKFDPKYHPYLYLSRVDKPIGTWLLFLPAAWTICMATTAFSIPTIILLAKFGVGAVLMRGAGCTINDYWDVDIDKRVVRTRDRPLASGKLSKKDALTWLGIQLGGSFLILLTMNAPTIVLGATSLLLVGTYPLFKRITNYPQLFLGLTINWGALMGYCAVTGGVNFSALMLYFVGVSWTMIYDTIYAHQDKNDDIRMGVGSTAIKFGEDTQKVCTGFTIAMVVGLNIAGLASLMGFSYFISIGVAGVLLLKGIQTINTDDPKQCWEFFVMNKNVGLLILLGIILGKFI